MELPVRSGGSGGSAIWRRSAMPVAAGALRRCSSMPSPGGAAVVPAGAPAVKKLEA